MSARILIAVTHLLGAGHLTRAAALARAFATAGHRVTLASGGMPATLRLPETVRLVQLPPVRIEGTAFARLLDPDGRPVDADRLAARRATLLDLLAQWRPDIVVTELYPFGRRALAPEYEALLEAAHRRRPRPLVLASVRDILAAPSRADRVATTHARLAQHYDGVLVHADPTLVRLEASWPTEGLETPLHYTGYVDEGEPVVRGSGDGIVVSGGSSAAGLPLAEAALAAAILMPERRWHVLVGHAVPADRLAALQRAAPANAQVERARSDFRALLAGADLSVSQIGYNTALDLFAAGCRALLVPFEGGRETEQRLRAETLAARGLAEILPEADLTPQRLAAAVRQMLDEAPPPAAAIAVDGAARSVAIVGELLARRAPAIGASRFDWRPLDEALARAKDEGRDPGLWWRDDDAVAHTPEFDRLLALARRHRWPLAIAAVPGRAEPSLAARLAEEPSVDVAVHGWIHRNHAPPGEKKAELGPHRPIDQLVAEAAGALAEARARLGPKILPVLVPPWNRIAPALTARLASLGYRGLSTFGVSAPPVPGLARIDAHVDPIDWHAAGRGLADPDDLVRRAVEAVEAGEAIGLLTHHGGQHEAVWAFCDALLGHLSERDGVVPVGLGALLRRKIGPAQEH